MIERAHFCVSSIQFSASLAPAPARIPHGSAGALSLPNCPIRASHVGTSPASRVKHLDHSSGSGLPATQFWCSLYNQHVISTSSWLLPPATAQWDLAGKLQAAQGWRNGGGLARCAKQTARDSRFPPRRKQKASQITRTHHHIAPQHRIAFDEYFWSPISRALLYLL